MGPTGPTRPTSAAAAPIIPLWLSPIDRLAARGGLVGRLAAWVSASLVMGCVVRFFLIAGRDRVLVLGGQAFTAVIPLAIVVASVATDGDALATRLIARFHLTGSAADAVRTLFSRPPEATGTISLLGFAARDLLGLLADPLSAAHLRGGVGPAAGRHPGHPRRAHRHGSCC